MTRPKFDDHKYAVSVVSRFTGKVYSDQGAEFRKWNRRWLSVGFNSYSKAGEHIKKLKERKRVTDERKK